MAGHDPCFRTRDQPELPLERGDELLHQRRAPRPVRRAVHESVVPERRFRVQDDPHRLRQDRAAAGRGQPSRDALGVRESTAETGHHVDGGEHPASEVRVVPPIRERDARPHHHVAPGCAAERGALHLEPSQVGRLRPRGCLQLHRQRDFRAVHLPPRERQHHQLAGQVAGRRMPALRVIAHEHRLRAVRAVERVDRARESDGARADRHRLARLEFLHRHRVHRLWIVEERRIHRQRVRRRRILRKEQEEHPPRAAVLAQESCGRLRQRDSNGVLERRRRRSGCRRRGARRRGGCRTRWLLCGCRRHAHQRERHGGHDPQVAGQVHGGIVESRGCPAPAPFSVPGPP